MTEPDRTSLPIRRGAFQGVTNRTLEGSQPDWNLIGHPVPPKGAPNVLLVLIDDAGFGNPSTFGGPIQTPNYTRMAEQGLKYNRFHVTALCSPTRAALLTGRNNHAVGFGSVGEFAGGFPGYSATLPRDCAPLPRILRDNGYSTAAFGKWHLTPDGQQGTAGPLDRWPNGWGFDYFYGFLGRRLGPVGPVPDREPEGDRDPGGVLRRRGSLLLPRRHGGQDHRVDPRGAGTGCRQAVLRVLLDRMQPRAASRRRLLGGQVQGSVRPRLGQASGGDLRAPEGARRRPRRRGADTARRRLPCVGRRAREAEDVLRPSDGGLRRLLGERRPQRRTRDRCDRGARRARQHGDHLDLGRQRRQHGGHRHGFVQRDDDAERHPADRRDAAPAGRALRRHGPVGRPDHGPALRRGLGVGGEHPVPVGQAGRLPPGWHAQPHGRALARTHHGYRRACARTSAT